MIRFPGTHTLWTLVGLALLAVWPSGAAAASRGDRIAEMLDRPGVRVVVVEFYATWCKPCMEAVPKWRAFHDRFRGEGLRLIAVDTQEPEPREACLKKLPWSPDETICDIDNAIAERMGVGERLPAATAWTWQGERLVSNAEFDETARAIKAYLKRAPRVVVEGSDVRGKSDTVLASLVVRELALDGRLQVVSDGESGKALAKIRSASHDVRKRDDQRCKLGAAVSANSLLKAKLERRARQTKLILTLVSAETQCLLGKGIVAYDKTRAERSVREGVASLMATLRRSPEGWSAPSRSGSSRPREGAIGDTGDDKWAPEGARSERGIVSFRSEPPGAVVLVDGKLLCQATPCKVTSPLGRHRVSMQREHWLPQEKRVALTKNGVVEWQLEADFATLDVATDPPGIQVRVGDAVPAATPLHQLRVAPGSYEIRIQDRCYRETGQRVNVDRGDTRRVTLDPRPRQAAVDVTATSASGAAIAANVTLDGKHLGQSPLVAKVPLCSKRLSLSHQDHAAWSVELTLVEAKTSAFAPRLQSKAMSAEEAYRHGAQHVKSGRLDEAITSLLQASEGGYVAAHGMLALVYKKKGNIQQMCHHGRTYIRVGAAKNPQYLKIVQTLLRRCP